MQPSILLAMAADTYTQVRSPYVFPLDFRDEIIHTDHLTPTERLRHSDERKYRAKWRRIRKAHFRMRQMRRPKP